MKNILLIFLLSITANTLSAQKSEVNMVDKISSIINSNSNKSAPQLTKTLYSQLSKNYDLGKLHPYVEQKITQVIKLRRQEQATDNIAPIMNLSYDHTIAALLNIEELKEPAEWCAEDRQLFDQYISDLPQLIKNFTDCIARFTTDDLEAAIAEFNKLMDWNNKPPRMKDTDNRRKQIRQAKRMKRYQRQQRYYNSIPMKQCRKEFEQLEHAIEFISNYTQSCF